MLCPHCKKMTLIDNDEPPSKLREAFEYISVEIILVLLIGIFVSIGFNQLFAIIFGIFMGIAAVSLFIWRRKKEVIYTCTSCKNVFDEETVNAALRIL